MGSDWHWLNLPGGFSEELVADLCDTADAGAGLGRGCVVIQTNATTSFHVSFCHSPTLPIRGTDQPALRFVVGKRKNSMTSVGLGSPYLKKEPIEFTRSADALLTDDAEKSRSYWFLYDRSVNVAAMGVQMAPQADLCRLVCRFQDTLGLRAEICENLRYVSLSSGKLPVSVRVVHVGMPPDVSIPRYRFDPVSWCNLEWRGSSIVFELDEAHRQLVQQAQKLLSASSIAPFYSLVEPACLCLNAYRLLDPLRRGELFPEEEDAPWETCFEELQRRLSPVLESAPWTYWPLRFDRADCTTITLAATGQGCSKAITEWSRAVQGATSLRNAATSREMLTLAFAFEVFPVEGENAVQARRELARQIAATLEKAWGVMEFRSPVLACWQTHTKYAPFGTALQW